MRNSNDLICPKRVEGLKSEGIWAYQPTYLLLFDSHALKFFGYGYYIKPSVEVLDTKIYLDAKSL